MDSALSNGTGQYLHSLRIIKVLLLASLAIHPLAIHSDHDSQNQDNPFTSKFSWCCQYIIPHQDIISATYFDALESVTLQLMAE